MRSLSVVIFAVALASGLCAPSSLAEETQDKMRDLTEALRDFHLASLSVVDPLVLEDIHGAHYAPRRVPIHVEFSSSNRMVNGLSNLEFTIVSTDPNSLTADFAVELPSLVYSSNYQIEGSVLNLDVAGEGNSSFTLEGYSSQVSFTLEEVMSDDENIKSPYIQIASIKQSSHFENFLAKITGLTVEGLTEEQVESLVEAFSAKKIREYIREHERAPSHAMLAGLNDLLVGKDIDDVITWLKGQTENESAFFAMLSFIGKD